MINPTQMRNALNIILHDIQGDFPDVGEADLYHAAEEALSGMDDEEIQDMLRDVQGRSDSKIYSV